MSDTQSSTASNDDRVQRVIEWLRKNQEKISLLERGKIEVNFAGWERASVRIALTIHDEA